MYRCQSASCQNDAVSISCTQKFWGSLVRGQSFWCAAFLMSYTWVSHKNHDLDIEKDEFPRKKCMQTLRIRRVSEKNTETFQKTPAREPAQVIIKSPWRRQKFFDKFPRRGGHHRRAIFHIPLLAHAQSSCGIKVTHFPKRRSLNSDHLAKAKSCSSLSARHFVRTFCPAVFTPTHLDTTSNCSCLSLHSKAPTPWYDA